jgi:hypothetical protein
LWLPKTVKELGMVRDPILVTDFLRRLSSDDAFRRRLEERPDVVLADYGLTTPAALPAQVVLPSKEATLHALAEAIRNEDLPDGDDVPIHYIHGL